MERRPGSRSCPSCEGPDGQTDVSSLEIKSDRKRESNVALNVPSTAAPPCLASTSVPCLACCCAQDLGERGAQGTQSPGQTARGGSPHWRPRHQPATSPKPISFPFSSTSIYNCILYNKPYSRACNLLTLLSKERKFGRNGRGLTGSRLVGFSALWPLRSGRRFPLRPLLLPLLLQPSPPLSPSTDSEWSSRSGYHAGPTRDAESFRLPCAVARQPTPAPLNRLPPRSLFSPPSLSLFSHVRPSTPRSRHPDRHPDPHEVRSPFYSSSVFLADGEGDGRLLRGKAGRTGEDEVVLQPQTPVGRTR